MLTASVVLFVYAALSGFVMAVGIFRGAKPWVSLALGHGVLAASALALALVAAITSGAPAIEKNGVGVLVLTALGGGVLLTFRLRGKPYPSVVVVLHALLAVGGVGCLAFALMQ